MKKGFIIAIDGPAAAGKGTIAPILASKLKGYHLYTGSMYRCVTLYCLENNISINNEQEIVAALPKIAINFDGNRILLNDVDVTQRIRQRDIDVAVSSVSNHVPVRQEMIKQQQKIGEEKMHQGKIVIVEGRDIATKVFPNAEVKIYLTAKPEIRARRRLKQLQERGVKNMTYEEILKETIERDSQDTQGKLGKLMPHPEKYGYHIIDDTTESEEQTLQEILALLKGKHLYND